MSLRRSCAQSGFTLLEIMVAMTVLTLIVTTAFGALRLGERSWEAGLRQSGETETLRSVSGVLQRLFSQALPIRWDENTEKRIAFSGDRQLLRFIAPAPHHHGATGLFEYTLALETHNDANRLMLYYRVHDPDIKGFAADGSDRQEVILVANLNTSEFRYYGAPLAKDPPRWHADWDMEAESFPTQVHVQLDAQPGRTPWPDLFLSLHASGDEP